MHEEDIQNHGYRPSREKENKHMGMKVIDRWEITELACNKGQRKHSSGGG